MTTSATADEIRVYWQPGCTSCLRTKEFLTRHGVAFVSRNILADAGALDEIGRFGLRSVPYVIKGERYANGQALSEVAELVGIDLGTITRLPAEELARRIDLVLEGAGRFLGQIPADRLEGQLPGRPRSYLQLAYHLFNVADAFLEQEAGIRLVAESYRRAPEPGTMSRDEVLAYGTTVRARIAEWFCKTGPASDWSAKANVYYGDVSRHEFYERTTWHCGQHARQLMWALERMSIAPDKPLSADLWVGLPMPENVWDPV